MIATTKQAYDGVNLTGTLKSMILKGKIKEQNSAHLHLNYNFNQTRGQGFTISDHFQNKIKQQQ